MSWKTFICFLAFCFINNVKSSKVPDYADVIEELGSGTFMEELEALNTTCARDLLQYVNGLIHAKLWALQMFDSSAKVPDGLMKGHLRVLGEFDECLEVEDPNGSFVGQYCLMNIDLSLKLPKKNDTTSNRLDDLLEDKNSVVPIKYGVCVPSTCSALELSIGFKSIIALISNISKHSLDDVLSLSFTKEQCRTKEPRELGDSDWAVVGFFIALGAIVLASTCYDVYIRNILKNDKPHQLLIPFSIYTNGKTLFQIIDSPSQLKPLHGMRVLSICWVVLVHAYMIQYSSQNAVNIRDVIKATDDINHVLIVNAIISVDTFFFIAGFLLCTIFFRDIKKKGYYDAPLGYIHRYIRLTPSYGFLILVVSTIYIYLGDGPVWYDTNQPSVDDCNKNWWSGILYIQSFVDSDSNCVAHSWYLSTDMHFYWLAPLVLYPMFIWPAYVFYFLGILLLVSVATNFTVAYLNDAGASLLTSPTNEKQMDVDYVKFYMRATPYIIGIATGYICHKIREKKAKVTLKKQWVAIGWLASSFFCLAALYGIRPFTDLKYTTIEASLYLALHRVAWGLGMAWIVFASLHGYGGIVNTFLSSNVFQPLGRLSYNVYLLHGLVQLYHIGSSKTNYYAGDIDIVYFFLGDVAISFLLAIPLTLVIEMPFSNIERYLLQNVKILPLPAIKRAKGTSSKEINNLNDIKDSNENTLSKTEQIVEVEK